MFRFFIPFFICLGFLISNLAAQQVDCKRWKNGSFAMYLDDGVKYTIIRKGTKQIENNSKTGWTAILKVKWIDECTYELRRKKIISNPNNVKEPEGLVITVHISETFEEFCAIYVKTNLPGDIGYKDLFYINKKE